MTLSHSLQPIHSNSLSESHSIHRRWTRCFCQDLLSNYQAEVSRRGRNHVFRTSKIKINGFCNLALSSVVTLRVLVHQKHFKWCFLFCGDTLCKTYSNRYFLCGEALPNNEFMIPGVQRPHQQKQWNTNGWTENDFFHNVAAEAIDWERRTDWLRD